MKMRVPHFALLPLALGVLSVGGAASADPPPGRSADGRSNGNKPEKKPDDGHGKSESAHADKPGEAARPDAGPPAEKPGAARRPGWAPAGLGRPIRDLADLTATRESRRAIHSAAVSAKLRTAASDPKVLGELERHARFEARLNVLEAKARAASKPELVERIDALREKETERHEANLARLIQEKKP